MDQSLSPRRIVLIAVLACSTLGCAELRLQDDDSPGVVAGKVAGRVVQGVFTFGGSELAYARQRRWENAGQRQVGRSITTVIQDLGPPSQIIPAGSDRIFVWSNTISVYLPGQSQTTVNAPYGGYGPLTATTTTSPGTMISRTGHLVLTVGSDDG